MWTGQTDMTKLIDAFRHFANNAKNCILQGHKHLNDRKKPRWHTFPIRGQKFGVFFFVVHVFVKKIVTLFPKVRYKMLLF